MLFRSARFRAPYPDSYGGEAWLGDAELMAATVCLGVAGVDGGRRQPAAERRRSRELARAREDPEKRGEQGGKERGQLRPRRCPHDLQGNEGSVGRVRGMAAVPWRTVREREERERLTEGPTVSDLAIRHFLFFPFYSADSRYLKEALNMFIKPGKIHTGSNLPLATPQKLVRSNKFI